MTTRILVITCRRETYHFVLDLLLSTGWSGADIDWEPDFEQSLDDAQHAAHAAYLVDYDLGSRTGLDWLRAADARRAAIPAIVFSTASICDLEAQVFEAGATAYLDHTGLNQQWLTRAVHYAIEKARITAQLIESESRYRSLVEVQEEMICRFLPDTTLTYVNPAYCRYFAMSAAELLGKPFLMLIPEEQHVFVRADIARMLETRKPVTYEHEAITPHGDLRWQRWTDHPILNEQGQVIELQSTGTDITELKLAQQRLQVSLEKERELSQLKSRFITMTSHEFRTPLASIRVTTETLKDFGDRLDDKDRRRRFQRIEDHVDHMAVMLDDILLIGQLEGGDIQLNTEDINIDALFAETIEEFQQLESAQQFVYAGPGRSITIHADRKLIRQIVTNLLSNAMKYSPPDTTIRLILTPMSDHVHIVVEDEGIGIPEEDLPHIFEPFHRGENIGIAKGTGLGLAVVRRAVEMHRGSIAVMTMLTSGTTFSLELPYV